MSNLKKDSYFYYKVLPKAPLFKSFTYKSLLELKIGQRVKIPFGPRTINGVILESQTKPELISKIKEILEVDQNSPALDQNRLNWLQWLSEYYHYPLGSIMDLSFITGTFKKRKAQEKHQDNSSGISLESSKKNSLANPESVFNEQAFLKLTQTQQDCFEAIKKHKGFQVHLIHGVTGSGKTEIYIRLIAEALKKGQQALMLLPEIFLTPQIVSRFSQAFPKQTALIHSQVTVANKKKAWRALLSGEKNLLVGTRSALFCPLPRLALIVIDEEHDSSFKQEDKFRYQARDSAIVLAKKTNIPIILGSATPNFSSYKKALDGSYHLYELKQRALKQSLPKVSIVDLKEERKKSSLFWLSDVLIEKMEQTLKQGQQVALFLNRRGQASSVLCISCGHTPKCLNCDISLTLHKQGYLMCHYCSYIEQKSNRCVMCQSENLLDKGLGTQKIEEELQKLFPNFCTLRLDRDNVSSQEEMFSFIKKVEQNEAQILIGTQMLSKGLNFPSIYLVGLILADMDFHFPDFRAEERSFQTLLQMAGRAGRAGFGEVILQTFNPENPIFSFAKQHDYKAFYSKAIKGRQTWFYPPYSRLCLLKIESLKEKEAKQFAKELAQLAQSLIPALVKQNEKIQILGPSPAPLMKIKNRYRFQILIKAQDHFLLDNFLVCFIAKAPKKTFVQLKIDRDPYSML